MFGGSSAPEEPFAPHAIVRKLGTRAIASYVVRPGAAGGPAKLAIAERFEGAASAHNEAGARLIREAYRIATLAGANVARVREVAVRGEDLVVIGEFIDGEKLQTFWPPKTGGLLPIEIALRIVLDVLSGLGALHHLRGSDQAPLNLTHGEVSPATVLVGLDGVARVLFAVQRREPNACAEGASLGYLAPEVHMGKVCDARADVFSVGVLLWEALTGTRLFSNVDGAAIAERLAQGIAPPVPPEQAPWARSLGPVVQKALAVSPDDRWPTTAAFAAAIRKVVGLKVASASVASAFARRVMTDRVRARREALESAPTAPWSGSAPSVWQASTIPSMTKTLVGAQWLAAPAPAAAPTLLPVPAPGEASSPSASTPERLWAQPLPWLGSDAPASLGHGGPSVDVPPPHGPSESVPDATPAPTTDPTNPAIPRPWPSPEIEHSTVTERAPRFDATPPRTADRRRTSAVLGAVGLLGALIFTLAALRIGHRAPSARDALGQQSPIAPAGALLLRAPVPLASPPPPAAPAVGGDGLPPAPRGSGAILPTATPAESSTPVRMDAITPVDGPAHAAPKHRASRGHEHAPVSSHPAHTRSHAKPTFDPTTL